MVELLLRNNANKDIPNTNGKTPEQLAKEIGNQEIITLLDKKDPTDNDDDPNMDNTELHQAIDYWDVSKIKEFLKDNSNKAWVNKKGSDGNIPLHKLVTKIAYQQDEDLINFFFAKRCQGQCQKYSRRYLFSYSCHKEKQKNTQ